MAAEAEEAVAITMTLLRHILHVLLHGQNPTPDLRRDPHLTTNQALVQAFGAARQLEERQAMALAISWAREVRIVSGSENANGSGKGNDNTNPLFLARRAQATRADGLVAEAAVGVRARHLHLVRVAAATKVPDSEVREDADVPEADRAQQTKAMLLRFTQGFQLQPCLSSPSSLQFPSGSLYARYSNPGA